MPGSMQQRCTANMTLMGRVLVSATNRAKRGTWRQIASQICTGHTHRTSTSSEATRLYNEASSNPGLNSLSRGRIL
jgi:hypothetical protein